MRIVSTFFLLLTVFTSLYAQPETEVYLGDFEFTNGSFSISSLENISDNAGYDNQPSFTRGGNELLYASSRDSNTINVVLYDLNAASASWLTDVPGGQYSPTIMPDGSHFSAIWLKPDGEQLLWKFPLAGGNPEVIIPNEVIGYHAWYDPTTLFAFVLGEPFTFVQFELKTASREVIAEYPGRSIHKIPGTDEVSFVDKSDSLTWRIKAYNPKTRTMRTLTETPQGSEDMYWIDGENFIIGNGPSLILWNHTNGWSEPVSVFREEGTITRISLSPDRTKIAIVFG